MVTLNLMPDELQLPLSYEAPKVFHAETYSVSSLPQLPVLSIRQPWAWSIATIGKDIENRTWPTKFRGEFLIHAGKGCTQNEYLDARDFALSAVGQEYRNKGIRFPGWKELDRGGIVGIAEIVDCVQASESKWFMGKYGFVIRNARPLPFVPCNGALGFFRLQNVESIHPETKP